MVCSRSLLVEKKLAYPAAHLVACHFEVIVVKMALRKLDHFEVVSEIVASAEV